MTRSVALCGLALALVALASQCAKPQCQLNSDCGSRRYCSIDNFCLQDCAEDRDCTGGNVCDPNGRCSKPPIPDASVDASPDVGVDDTTPVHPLDVVTIDAAPDNPPPDNPPPDLPVAPDVPIAPDNPPPDLPPPPDVPPPDVAPRGQYLDPCAVNPDCASGDCAVVGVAAGFCTRGCVTRNDCGDGYLCALPPGGGRGRCLPDDTGTPCDPRTAAPCARFCYTTTGSSRAHCTRECAAGRDCPAGYACQNAGTASVCVEVERPCSRGSDCATSLCLGPMGSTFRGCTSACRTAADCPVRMIIDDSGRLVALPAYTCQVVSGESICVPPIQGVVAGGDLVGSDPIGATCDATPGASVLCRSGVCDGESPATCVQRCTPAGGCPNGFACRPWLPDGPTGSVYLVCRPAGGGALNSTCTRGSDCTTALCQSITATTGYCTRFCNDGACPTGMRCSPAGTALDGTAISLCLR